ncbi:MAG: glycosyltransferase family 39 protein [Patescibacteria group bacterium]
MRLLETERERERWYRLCFLGILLWVGFWATRYLLDSPRPWFDEGIYLQAAKNLAEQGRFGIQVAPGRLVGLDMVTVGYPLLAPLAGVFKLFGATLEAARGMMVGWIMGLVILLGMLCRRLYGRRVALLALGLLASFGPLYGNGKNVLGEIPGLVYLSACCLVLLAIERGKRGWGMALLSGGLLALSATTKPSFIILLPAAAVALCVWWWRGTRFSWGEYLGAFAGVSVGLLVWVLTQFHSASLGEVLAHYANPYGIADLATRMRLNMVGMVTHGTPLHMLLLGGVTLVAWMKRGARRLSAVEIMLGAFILLTLVSYVRTAGWYRYFFLAHVLLLVLAPSAILFLASQWFKVQGRRLAIVIIIALFGVNGYALWRDPFPIFGTDWRALRQAMQGVPMEKTILFVNAPEAAFFYPRQEYYQLLRITERLTIGEDILSIVPPPHYLIMTDRVVEGDLLLGRGYVQEQQFGHVAVWRYSP